jgi:hypothetical protein
MYISHTGKFFNRALLVIAFFTTRYFSCQQSFLGLRDLCINRNNHQKPTFHPLGDFLNPALALLGQGLKKSPIGQKSVSKIFTEFCLEFLKKEPPKLS